MEVFSRGCGGQRTHKVVVVVALRGVVRVAIRDTTTARRKTKSSCVTLVARQNDARGPIPLDLVASLLPRSTRKGQFADATE
jgi:hypothetical protein